jgi:DnaJ-class molecular chaperone
MPMKETCPTCGGSGQICFFQGVSRLLLSSEECPSCTGLGFVRADDSEKPQKSKKTAPKKSNLKGEINE